MDVGELEHLDIYHNTHYLVEEIHDLSPNVRVLSAFEWPNLDTSWLASWKDHGNRLILSQDIQHKLKANNIKFAAYVTLNGSSTIHLPLWIPGIGIAACQHRTVLSAEFFEVPSGEHLGEINISATGEAFIIQYAFAVFTLAETKAKVLRVLAEELVKKLEQRSQ